MGPVFDRLHIIENIVGVQKMFYLKINVWKIYSKAVAPNLFVTAEGSMHDNFTATREYFMMVALFQQPKWSYQYEPLDKAATVCSFAPSPTLSLYAPMLSLYAPSSASTGKMDKSHVQVPALSKGEKWGGYAFS